jgi:hypothetical protein
MVAEKASAVILADAAATPATPPSRADLRHVLSLLPRPRKPARSAVIRPSEVEEIR